MKLASLVSKSIMHSLFAQVFGYKGHLPANLTNKLIHGMDGSRIQSLLLEPFADQNVKAVVVLAHPFLKYGLYYFLRKEQLINCLRRAGFAVVLFNFKGFGNSTVNGVQFSTDVLSVSQYLKYIYPNIPRILIGYSFGGYQAVHAVALRPESFKGIILDSVPLRIASFFTSGIQGHIMRWLSESKYSDITGTKELRISLDLLEDKPLYILYGSDDEYLSSDDKAYLQQLVESRCHSKIIVFENNKHLTAINQVDLNYHDYIVQCVENIIEC